MDPSYLNLDPEERTNKIMALFSVMLGIASLCGGIIPIAGVIASGLGILTGVFGRRSESRRLATAGIIISALGLTVSVVYALFLLISY